MSEHDPVFDAPNASGRLFLERRGYRQRRIIDAARILPIVGLLLWLVPLIWPDVGEDGAISASQATLYVFAIWIALIGVGGFLAWRMSPSEDVSGDETEQSQGAER